VIIFIFTALQARTEAVFSLSQYEFCHSSITASQENSFALFSFTANVITIRADQSPCVATVG
jgi:hypothetical protein